MQVYPKKRRPPNPNRSLDTKIVLERLSADIPGAFQCARVVGRWVWVEFDGKPSDEIRAALKALGFHYSANREAWQHPCGKFSGKSRRDPRHTYGSYRASDVLDDSAKAVA